MTMAEHFAAWMNRKPRGATSSHGDDFYSHFIESNKPPAWGDLYDALEAAYIAGRRSR